jgi:hypothetical protein
MDIRQYITMKFGQWVAIILLHRVFSSNCFGVGMVHDLDICFLLFSFPMMINICSGLRGFEAVAAG